MSERLTRKEIKRDEFVEALERSASFVERNVRVLIASAVALVVVVAAGFGIWWWLEVTEARASAAFTEALEVYRAPVGEGAAPESEGGPTFADEAARRDRAAELFAAVRDDYGRSGASDVAGVYLAQIAVETGDPERARELWQEFVDERPDHVLAGQVRVNLIHLDRQQGRAEEVVSRLEPMLTADPTERPLPGDVVLWELAQTYEALGRGDEAEATYRRLTEEYPTSAYASQASQKLPREDGAPAGSPLNLESFG
jgi:tetratricopeptide (TPR) repeat protein